MHFIQLQPIFYLFIYRAQITILGNIPNTELYVPLSICEQAIEINRIKIIRFDGSLYYYNAENFKKSILKAADIESTQTLKQLKRKWNSSVNNTLIN